MSSIVRKSPVPSDIEIAQAATHAAHPGDRREGRHPRGRARAVRQVQGQESTTWPSSSGSRTSPDGKIIDVTAITPTPLGEGKTVDDRRSHRVDERHRHGHDARACASPPSARSSASRAARPAAATRRSSRWRTSTSTSPATSTPSARAQPARRLIDNHLMHGNELEIDPLSITWRARRRPQRPRAARDRRGLGGSQRLPRARPASTSPSPPRSWPSWPATEPQGPARAPRPHRLRLQQDGQAVTAETRRRRRDDGPDEGRHQSRT